MEKHKIFTMRFSKVYPLYIAKAERKGRSKSEVDQIICWLTGYTQKELENHIDEASDFETFLLEAKKFNPLSKLITGSVCGVKVESIEDPMMQKIRYLDKLIDELAKGKAMDKILRKE